jgi:hypothetical protein
VVITSYSIIVNSAWIHFGLTDDIVGQAFKQDVTDSHFSLTEAILGFVEQPIFFHVIHHTSAKDLTQTHIQVSLNQSNLPDTIYFGSTRFFWDQSVGNFFPLPQ